MNCLDRDRSTALEPVDFSMEPEIPKSPLLPSISTFLYPGPWVSSSPNIHFAITVTDPYVIATLQMYPNAWE